MFPRAPHRCSYPGKLHLGILKPQASGVAPGPHWLSLPDPGDGGLRRLARRLVLAIAPVTAGALFVTRSPAGGADHRPILASGSRSRVRRRAEAVSIALRRRWRGASCGAVPRPAHPHSGRPTCRTFLAGEPRRLGIPPAPGKRRTPPSPYARGFHALAAAPRPARRRARCPCLGTRRCLARPNSAAEAWPPAHVPQT